MAEIFKRRTKVISTSGAPIEEIQNAMKATTPFKLCFQNKRVMEESWQGAASDKSAIF
jgi:hypothetical protein